ncbi:hypothetical protein Pcinc_012658 [Petrolisthes cinctipes]|uniref:DH domain-containing protein n=1 Tax=Petrolisthes cinctipes TaxID=88211 RepID=A0AAE1G0S7_PETCI|nr:hypothetical protein Pcinc_012658 [Petrolisthes cinctipes]
MSVGVIEAEGVMVGAVRVDTSLRNVDSDTRRHIALQACREIEMSCGETAVRGDGGSDFLGAVDITQNSKHCHIRLQHGVLSVTISGCGEIRMPQRTVALVQKVPLHPSSLLLLGRLSQCPLRLGEKAVRAAVVIEFEYKDDLEALMTRMKEDKGRRITTQEHSTPTASSSSVQHQRRFTHQSSPTLSSSSSSSSSSTLTSHSLSTPRPGLPSTRTVPSVERQLGHLSASRLPQGHHPVPPLAENPPPITQQSPTSTRLQHNQSPLPQHNQSPLPQHNKIPLPKYKQTPSLVSITSSGTHGNTSLTKPAIPPHPSPRHNSPRCEPSLEPSKSVSPNTEVLVRPQQQSVHGESTYPNRFQFQMVRQESDDGYIDMTGKASTLNSNLHDTPQQHYANCLPVSDSSARQCNEIIKNVIESEDKHISKLEGIGRSLANSRNNPALMETVKKAYDFHRLVLRREMKRMHTARQLAETFVNCSEIFKIYKDLLQDYSKSFHRPSTSSNMEDFLLIITKLQYYEDVIYFLLKQATSSYMFRQALIAIKIPLDVVKSHLIFDRVDVCPISRHHHGPALRIGWIQLTGRAPPGIGKVFAILTETHLIFTLKSLKQERLTYTSDIKLKSASFWVEENCMTIEDTRCDGGQRRIYNMHINTDLEFGAWESSIRDAMQKQTENTEKPYSEC